MFLQTRENKEREFHQKEGIMSFHLLVSQQLKKNNSACKEPALTQCHTHRIVLYLYLKSLLGLLARKPMKVLHTESPVQETHFSATQIIEGLC